MPVPQNSSELALQTGGLTYSVENKITYYENYKLRLAWLETQRQSVW